ncbi:2-oxoglutarate-dependent dioxygenase frbA [Exophiala dermatitidis]|uniref:Fe2OG dioxygenase domain-containing protein n=2 Tax=Exophiala dermatitidis TaxID=5970 RepID=H6BYM6_EXODN|nr:uncharacterized protein HMPREF1120_04808 [Exophiala dermatitidis NIH/UT8656]EHY56741.1 hypothetical protein HMPREF1120_04808 [Exophiala dermatitidis NIH/UT8656]
MGKVVPPPPTTTYHRRGHASIELRSEIAYSGRTEFEGRCLTPGPPMLSGEHQLRAGTHDRHPQRLNSHCPPWLRGFDEKPYKQAMAALASIDLSQLYRDGQLDQELRDELLNSCATYGFVKFVGHGLSDERIHELFAWSREFFGWPDEVKQSANRSNKGPYRGYAGVGREQIGAITGYIKGVKDGAPVTDVKECFDLGPVHDTIYPTPWPVVAGARGEEFRSFMQSFFADCVQLHDLLVSIFEQALHLEDGEISQRCSAGNGEVRITHYPPIAMSQLQTGRTFRIAEHTDVGILTLLFQDSVGGLEIEDPARPGQFVAVESSRPSEMIVNIADTLQRWTSGVLKSTNHRVLAPQRREGAHEDEVVPARYSVGFFGKANMDAPLTPLPSLLSSTRNQVEASNGMTAQEYYNYMHEKTAKAVSEPVAVS